MDISHDKELWISAMIKNLDISHDKELWISVVIKSYGYQS